VRDQAAEHHQVWRRGRDRGHRRGRLDPVTDDGEPRGVDAERDEFLRRGAGHRDVTAPAIEPGGEHGLHPPAHGPTEPAENDRPLLAVHVVDEHDHGAAGHERGAEGQAVLDVDDQAWPVPQHVQQGSRVDAEPAAPADDTDPADDLVGGRPVVGGAEHRDPESRPRETLGHSVDVAFRAPAFGVGDVPPVDEEDIDRR
jgi:hypothetical protein